MILEAIIPALLPAAADGIRAVINKITGNAGARPSNVGEVIQLMQAETSKLEALAKLDTAENVSQWVANVRAMQRPAASVLIILAYVGSVYSGADNENLAGYAQMVTFYLFGDRTYTYMKRKK